MTKPAWLLLGSPLAWTALAAACAQAPARLPGDPPRLHYQLRYQPPATPAQCGAWLVKLRAEGLPPAQEAPRLVLAGWGDWIELDAYYLEILECDPPLAGEQGPAEAMELSVPPAWDGTLRLTYRIRPTRLGSSAQHRWGLLPTAGATYTLAQSRNTLVQIAYPGHGFAAEQSIELLAPGDMVIFTGWAGWSRGRQAAPLAVQGEQNGFFAAGYPRDRLLTGIGDQGYEIVQFGAGRGIAAEVLEIVSALAPAIGRDTGVPPRQPLRVFISDSGGGGMGTDFGLHVGFRADSGDGYQRSPYFQHLVAHELFHDWLGIRSSPDSESLAWFFEGFTDYLSLWYVAAQGVVTRDWFAERLLELEGEARQRSALGQAAFGDPNVDWRDGDGPKEILAYKGGAVLAFAADVALRAQGRPGLVEMVRDFLALEGATFTREDIRAWFESHGLSELYRRSILGTELPDAGELLAASGFDLVEEEAPLTYLGIEAAGDGLGAVVRSVAPGSPAQRAGVRSGDRINGYYPARGAAPSIIHEPATSYRFGLTLFEPGRTGAKLWVVRDGAELEIPIVPELMPGGGWRRLRAAPGRSDAFFRFQHYPTRNSAP